MSRSFVASSEIVFEMVRRGLGIGVVPHYILEQNKSAHEVMVAYPTGRRLYDYLWVNEISVSPKSSVVELFNSHLTMRFRQSSF